MNKKSFDFELYHRLPVIGILRGQGSDQVIKCAELFNQAGFTTLEVTMNSENALETVSELLETFRGELNIGVGTVRTILQTKEVLNAGAQFVVSPIIDPEVIELCLASKVPIFPGAYTPTEIETAWRLGATAVKLFPAEIGGLPYLKAIKAPLDDIPLIPTGGVTLNNIGEFFQAGIFGAGIGGGLFPKELMNDSDGMLKHLKSVASAYYNWKSS